MTCCNALHVAVKGAIAALQGRTVVREEGYSRPLSVLESRSSLHLATKSSNGIGRPFFFVSGLSRSRMLTVGVSVRLAPADAPVLESASCEPTTRMKL